jgi:hypothetical protein
MKYGTLLKIGLLIILIGGIAACERVGELTTENKTIQLGEAKSAEIEIKMGAGELFLQGGSQALMEGSFTTNIKRWKPEVDYHTFSDRGILRIEQHKHSGIPLGNTENRWDIRLNNEVPTELSINLGAGESKFSLQGMSLKSLDIDMGVGELTLDLSGEHKQNLDVKIDGGVGSGTIYLPENVGVRVKVNGGLGSVHAAGFAKSENVYTNEAYGKSNVLLDLRIKAGIGSIDLRLK